MCVPAALSLTRGRWRWRRLGWGFGIGSAPIYGERWVETSRIKGDGEKKYIERHSKKKRNILSVVGKGNTQLHIIFP